MEGQSTFPDCKLIVSQKDLEIIHTKEYLELIKKPSQVGFVADMPFYRIAS